MAWSLVPDSLNVSETADVLGFPPSQPSLETGLRKKMKKRMSVIWGKCLVDATGQTGLIQDATESTVSQ